MSQLQAEINNLPNLPLSEELTIFCPVTNKELFVEGKGYNFIHSHGACRECGRYFAKEALYFPNNLKDPYPVRYTGRICCLCSNSPQPDPPVNKPHKSSKNNG